MLRNPSAAAFHHQVPQGGTTLFARTSRRVEITAAGERFVGHAREALAAAELAVAEARASTGQITGSLTIGLIPTVTAIDIPQALGRFHRRHPMVRVLLRGGASEELMRGLVDGELDVAVLGLHAQAPVLPGVATRELLRTRHVAVVSEHHRLAGRRRVSLADLAGESFADFPADTGGRRQSDLAFERARLARQVAFEAIAPELLCGLVEQGLAVALLPASLLTDRPALRSIAVADGPSRVEYLAWREFNPSPAASAFLAAADPPDGRQIDPLRTR